MTAPDQLWIDFEPRDYPCERVMYGPMPSPYVEYIRRDPAVIAALPEVQALIASKLEEAADACWHKPSKRDIRALITHSELDY